MICWQRSGSRWEGFFEIAGCPNPSRVQPSSTTACRLLKPPHCLPSVKLWSAWFLSANEVLKRDLKYNWRSSPPPPPTEDKGSDFFMLWWILRSHLICNFRIVLTKTFPRLAKLVSAEIVVSMIFYSLPLQINKWDVRSGSWCIRGWPLYSWKVT